MKDLPIYPYLEGICLSLLASPSRFLVLTAETAAGKSTAVPIALLLHVKGKIVMLEPRRIATLAIANRIASLLGEESGKTAGYRIHLDSKVSADTRIEVITEAILTRWIQGDPSLAGISVVILDEFHERSVHTDLALALLREVVSLRDDLYVIVMSATIDTARIAAYLDSPVVSVPGRQWPIEISYSVSSVSSAIKGSLLYPGGNILVFLPGISEIRRERDLLGDIDAEVLILHSSVPFEEQRRVLEKNPAKRRVILSSSIAETSITIPGVSVVIDSGLSRISRLDVRTGMNRLVTETESRFSAIQRAGRAGRTGAGKCIRLWAENDSRVAETPPEISRTDIMPLVLECALWGVSEMGGIAWLDPPNAGAWSRAKELLVVMEAIDNTGRITELGRQMANLGVHPRIAAIALAGNADIASRFSQYSENPREMERFRSDLERRAQRAKKFLPSGGVSHAGMTSTMYLLIGFPDRIARHVSDGIYQFPSGRLAALPKDIRQGRALFSSWIVAPEADAGEREGRIWSFEELPEEEALAWLFRHSTTSVQVFQLETKNSGTGQIRKTEYRMYGKLVLSEKSMKAGPEDISAAFCANIRKSGLGALPWSATSESFLVRARCWYRGDSLMDGQKLLDSLEDWLVPFIPPNTSLTPELFLQALRFRCDSSAIDRDLPTRITLPSGIDRPILYVELKPGESPVPVLEIKIQDLFGCAETPRIMGIPVLLRLLSPARRPLQITDDLAGFWKNTWPTVIKEMKGRYPKHKWPENPFTPIK